MSLANCASCGRTFQESRGTYSEAGLICGDCSELEMDLDMDASLAPRGSMVLGLLAGFFGGCFGLVLVLIFAKGDDTKKGAGFGFAAQIVISLLLRVLAQLL